MIETQTLFDEPRNKAELYWEDIAIGQTWQLGDTSFTRQEIIDFASRYDPQPFHLDQRKAERTILNGLAASGWHVCIKFMNQLHLGLLSSCRGADIRSVDEIKWQAPVRANERLSCQAVCTAKPSASSREGLGACRLYCAAIDASGRTVMSWRLDIEMARRTSAGYVDAGHVDTARRPGVARSSNAHPVTFFEDICLGNEITLGPYTFTEGDIGAFNREFLPHEVGKSAMGCRSHASIWHVSAIWVQLLVRYYHEQAKQLQELGRGVPELGPSPGIKQLRWQRPVRAEERLTFSCWVDRKIPVERRSGWGLLLAGVDGLSEENERVVSFFAFLLIESRNRANGSLSSSKNVTRIEERL